MGKMPLRQFTRLQELLVSGDGDQNQDQNHGQSPEEIDVSLDFTRTETGLPIIKGHVKGELSLECQRCLQPVSYSLDSHLATVLITTDTEAVTLQEGFDTWLLEEDRLFLQDFIEDEIMLALPLVLRHEDCEAERPLIEALPEDEIEVETEVETDNGQEEEQENPFAVLKNFNLKD